MTIKDLTEKQKSILNIIEMYINDYGYPPTVRELCDLSDTKSTSTIYGHLDSLENKGYIIRQKGSARTLRLVNRSS